MGDELPHATFVELAYEAEYAPLAASELLRNSGMSYDVVADIMKPFGNS